MPDGAAQDPAAARQQLAGAIQALRQQQQAAEAAAGRCQPLAERPAKLSGPTMSDGWWSRRPISRDTIFRQRTEPVLQKSDRGGSNRR